MNHRESERRTELDNFDILEEKAERAALIENKAVVKVLLDIQRQHRDEMQDVREAAIVADRALQMAKKREHIARRAQVVSICCAAACAVALAAMVLMLW